jgi:LAO/AO transport system kinase
MTTLSAGEIVDRAVAGDRRHLARAITLVEARDPTACGRVADLAVRRRSGPGAPHVIGLTGPPGAGKSTLSDRIVGRARAAGRTIAVVAVDPSSPYTGGASLGDRIRLERHTGDDGVFVRSMSSRGHLGGLSAATGEVVDLLDAAGFAAVLVETVGVGQSELAVVEVADTTIVVLTPESGDTVQTMKAGLLEIADVFVVNKADRPGADALVRDLELSVSLTGEGGGAWAAPVHATSATEDRGIDEVLVSAERHLTWSAGTGRTHWDRRRADARVRAFLDLVAEHARGHARNALAHGLEDELRSGRTSPRELVRRIRGPR